MQEYRPPFPRPRLAAAVGLVLVNLPPQERHHDS